MSKVLSHPLDILPDLADSSLVGTWLNKAVRNSGKDYSVNGNDGTPANVAWERVGGDFDGAASIINCGSDGSLDNIFDGGGAIGAWFYMDSAGQNNAGRLIEKGSWHIRSNGGTDFLRMEYAFSGDDLAATFPVDIDAWNCLLLTLDNAAGNSPIVYVNGNSVTVNIVLASTGTRTTDAASSLIIGSTAAAGVRTWDGRIKDIRVYDSILSADWAKYDFLRSVPE